MELPSSPFPAATFLKTNVCSKEKKTKPKTKHRERKIKSEFKTCYYNKANIFFLFVHLSLCSCIEHFLLTITENLRQQRSDFYMKQVIHLLRSDILKSCPRTYSVIFLVLF